MRLSLFLLVLTIIVPIINGFNNNPRKLQDASPPGDLVNKCGGCPCNSPCVPVSPPPPPPSPPPPSPSPPPPAPTPPSTNCPPPPPPPTCGPCGNVNPSVPTPSAQFIYGSGPAGNLYPVVDADYSQAAQQYTVGFPLLIGCIILLCLQVLL